MTPEKYIKLIEDMIDGMEKDGHLIDAKANTIAGAILYEVSKIKLRFKEIENENTRIINSDDVTSGGLHDRSVGETGRDDN